MKITILGNPPSDNTSYGNRVCGKRVIRYLTKRAKAYKSLVRRSIKEIPAEPTDKPMCIEIEVYFGDKRKRDIQGHLKCLIDAFQGIYYKDDSQIRMLNAIKYYDKEIPRTEVYINEFTP